ncbi:UNKNOWN [Stylonychia lemnae]|uniref:Uncharacterized protein n=1 Tax=Stylonychia lemnae TaxID=5949 RepID=A0A078A5X8_STYLE|nr:UNKNOWN [Stylonychia lemnae]|eukprot:CDW76164.1 UNKNOWN [Stylonychia lemnae]
MQKVNKINKLVFSGDNHQGPTAIATMRVHAGSQLSINNQRSSPQPISIKDFSQYNQNGDQNNFIITNSQSPQIIQQIQNNQYPIISKPKTSFGTNRNHNKAVVKMKLHSFDPLGLGNLASNESSPFEAGRLSVNALHLGSVQTKNLFLNTVQPGQNNSANVQTYSSPVINSANAKSKVFFPTQVNGNGNNSKTFKMMQNIPQQARVQTAQQAFTNRPQRQIFPNKKVVATGAVQSINQNQLITLPQANQNNLILKHQSTPLVGTLVNQEGRSLNLYGSQLQTPKLFTQTSTGPFFHRNNNQQTQQNHRGGSQLSQRNKLIEDKNMRFLNNQINQGKIRVNQEGKVGIRQIGTRSCEELEEFADGFEQQEQNSAIYNEDQASPSNQRYSGIDFNSIYSQQIQNGFGGRNSDPTTMSINNFRQADTFLNLGSNGTIQDQVSTQIQHQKTQASNNISSQNKNQWPKKNTQGLQGSIYSSSAASSIEGDNIQIYNQMEDNESQVKIINQEKQQPTLRLIKRHSHNEFNQAKPIRAIDDESLFNKEQTEQQRNSLGKIQQVKRNFGSTLNPADILMQMKAQEHTNSQQDIPFSVSSDVKTAKQQQRKIISKNNIKFARASVINSDGTNGAGSLHPDKMETLQSSNISPPLELVNDLNIEKQQQQQQPQKKAIKKIRDAQQIADSFDKKGIGKAIVQYQFEMADKEEENCFKGLYDALNQFF